MGTSPRSQDPSKPLPAPTALWSLEGPPGAQHLFRALASKAAAKLLNATGNELWKVWLDNLRAEGYASKMPDRQIKQPLRELSRARPTIPYPPGFEDEKIDNVFQASAEFCFAHSIEEGPSLSEATLAAQKRAASGSQPAQAPDRQAATNDSDLLEAGRQPGNRSPANTTQSLNPSRNFLYERLSPDDSNYDLLKRFALKGWGDSFELVRKGFAGEASLQDFIDGCVTTFAQSVEVHVELKDETPISERCREVGRLAEEFIRVFSAALDPESDRLGKDTVNAAVEEFSRRIDELSAGAKTRILQSELALQPAVQPTAPEARKKRGRQSTFTPDLLNRAFQMKQAGKQNVEIARILYQTLTPTDHQRRSVPTILKHHFGSKKNPSRVEE